MQQPAEISEERALALAEQAVEAAGGTRAVYRNPRHPFAPNAITTSVIGGVPIELRHGEISSPAIVTVGGWVFEILEESIELLMKPVVRKPPAS